MTRRAAVYARFSSDRQNEKSCSDQIALCEAWAEREGLTVTASYEDAAVSGASTVNRFGLASLMRDARARRFDVVLCEALDRLSRDQADLARIKKELAFLDIAIMTVQDGEVGAMHIGLKGLMGELYLADLAQKTRRGQSARVREGAIGGGRSFGYQPGANRGELAIVEAEAETVRRIFAAYLAGRTGRQIAGDLNAEGVPGPRGGKWNASAIVGSAIRKNGILQNRLYAGEIVWNRQRFIKDPATGKRVSRPNPESEWIIAAAPQLAIIDSATFAAVEARRAERSIPHPSYVRKPRHVLSGLLKCGCCGASYTTVNRGRLICAGHRERKDCTNGRSIARKFVEDRVLQSLRQNLDDPEMIAAFLKAYHEERALLASTRRRDSSKLRRGIAELTRGIEQIVDRVIAGTVTPAIEARLPAMEAERQKLQNELDALEQSSEPVTLHPSVANRYARMVEDLHHHLMDERAPPDELLEQVRALVTRVEIAPGQNAKGPVNITVYGPLAAFNPKTSTASAPSRGKLVAGTGFEPVTFRL